MKYIKNVTILLFVAGFSFTQAQTEKGKVLIGGGTKMALASDILSTKSNQDNKENYLSQKSFELNPVVAYFVVNNLALGLEIPITHQAIKYFEDYSESSLTTSALCFLRLYFNENDPIKPYIHGGIGLGLGLRNSSYTDLIYSYNYKAKYNLVLGKISAGVSAFINEKIALDIGIGYQYIRSKRQQDNPSDYRSISNGFASSIGFSFVL